MTQPVRQGICRAPQQEGRLEAGETGKLMTVVSIGFAVSTSPMPFSLVTFLHGCKKVTLIGSSN